MNIRRLFKNIVFLYVRMLILLIVMFYTSRVLLKELGVNDFGLYNVVGGIVLLFSSLKTIFSSAIQRFINTEKGNSSIERIQEIFSAGVYIHIVISVLFFIIVEIAGLWYIQYKLVAAPERLDAAYWVLHFSVLSSIVMIMTIPYDALVIANEKMDFYAYVSIIDGILRLLIVFCLFYFDYDKLKLYSVLVFLVSLVIRCINMLYCKRCFLECKLVKVSDKGLIKNMTSFAAWNFIGNLAYSVSHEGINILLNMFCGTAVNAARGVVYQIKNALTTILRNIVIAIHPQGISLYAEGKMDEFVYLLNLYTRSVSFIYLLMALPLFFYADSIIQFWLGMVPTHVITFLKIILLYLLFRTLHYPIDLVFKAAGELKKYQINETILLFLTVVLSYISLRKGGSMNSPFWIMLLIECINYSNILLLAGRSNFLCVSQYVKNTLVIIFVICCITVGEFYLIQRILENLNVVLQILIQLTIVSCTIFLIGFNKSEKIRLRNYILRQK